MEISIAHNTELELGHNALTEKRKMNYPYKNKIKNQTKHTITTTQ